MNAKTELVRQNELPVTAEVATPSALLAIAVQQGADMAKLEKLMDLQERWEKNEARKAFTKAMAAFKANPPVIVKDKTVIIKHKDGGGTTEYDHASIGNVVGAITKGLGEHGLSHRWQVTQDIKEGGGGRITVTCFITHEMGHTEEVSMSGPPDTSGSKNNIQAIASTVTYLERYTLLAATGLATNEMPDDDGRGSEIKRIDEKQLADLKALAEEVKANVPAMLKFFKIDRLEDLSVEALPEAIRMLEMKRKRA